LEVIGEVNVLKVCKQKRRFDVRLARVHSGLQTDWSSTLSVVIRNISDWLLAMASATCRSQSFSGPQLATVEPHAIRRLSGLERLTELKNRFETSSP
jgi:hypothetical protein